MTKVNFFNDGFFGYSNEQDFFMGSIWHILPIILMLIAIILIYKYRKQIRNYKYESRIRYILAFVMLIVEMSFFWRLLYVGTEGVYDTLLTYLPIQMCQWGLIISVFTIISKNKKLFSISYFIESNINVCIILPDLVDSGYFTSLIFIFDFFIIWGFSVF